MSNSKDFTQRPELEARALSILDGGRVDASHVDWQLTQCVISLFWHYPLQAFSLGRAAVIIEAVEGFHLNSLEHERLQKILTSLVRRKVLRSRMNHADVRLYEVNL